MRDSILMLEGTPHQSALLCPSCRMSMKLVFIEPRVASSSELHIFRCIGCGDVRAIEQKTTSHNQAAKTRPSFFD